MRIQLVADPTNCGERQPCTKIWRTEDGRYWIQGERPPAELLAHVALPDHEFIVEYDKRLISWMPAED